MFAVPDMLHVLQVVINVLRPVTFAFLFMGAMLPYWFTALCMKSVGTAAMAMVKVCLRAGGCGCLAFFLCLASPHPGGGGRRGTCLFQSGGCLPQPRWAVSATGAGAHQGQTSREGEKDIWWTARIARGGTGHLGRTETQRGRLWMACGQRCVDSKNSQTTPATTSTPSIRQLLGAADAQTAHHATSCTAPTHQLLGSANAETAPAPAAAADRTQRPDATCEGTNG